MDKRMRTAAIVAVMSLSAALASTLAAADTGSAAFDRYVQDVRQRLQAAHDGSYWNSTLVDQGAFERYLAAMGRSSGGPAMSDTASWLAGLDVQPLRTFNSYLAYLGRRMRADAGPPGALLDNDKGTDPFDRYVEEINYRIQALDRAAEGTGF